MWLFNSSCLECFLMVYQLLSHMVFPLTFRKPPSWSILQGPFHPSEVVFLSLWLVGFYKDYVLWCLLCHVPSSYEVWSLYLVIWVGFWGCDLSTATCLSPWIFFPCTTWIHIRLDGFPSLLSWEHISNISTQSDMVIPSYWPSNADTKFGH